MLTVLAAAKAPGPEVLGPLNQLLGWAAGLIGLICFAKVVIVAARIAWDHKHTAGLESPPAAELLASLVAWVVAGTAAGGIAAALMAASQ